MLTIIPTPVWAEATATQKDYWDSEVGDISVQLDLRGGCLAPNFVDTLIDSVKFKPTDHGILISRLAPQIGYVLGVDSSLSMIESAKKMDYGFTATEFRVADC
ncbi:S-adenosyl-L-methionine-dependent methyltransferase [Penicillium antarcticum]|uniref:S-adenosyl-L-methionine-dependent methyltransferase n=1 Tax=Penicillium antarcticum TaxID=416450 RepID=UPI002396171A|nr:S-adenosyl-L-methionine-dependent methyltransferase [Penicillium antarcticum]KAJ5320349.1 S-adenosyl-L-methionine-dependent methyltransferase [Penicillium antarcticum]